MNKLTINNNGKYFLFAFIFICFLCYSCGKEKLPIPEKNQIILQKFEKATAYETSDIHADTILKYALDVISISNQISDKDIIISANIYAGSRFNETGNPDSAYYFARRAYDLAQNKTNHYSLARIHNLYGLIYLKKADFQQAYQNINKAIQLSISSENQDDHYTYIMNMGNVHTAMNKADSALYFFQLAANYYTDIKQNESLSKCLGNMGSIHNKLQNYPEAIKYYKQALKINRDLNNWSSLSHNYSNIGVIYNEINKNDTAVIYYDSALMSIEKTGNRFMKMVVSFNYANVLLETEKFERAKKMYYDALNQAENQNSPFGIYNAYSSLGNVYLKTGLVDKSLEYYQKAYQLALEKNIRDNKDDLLLDLTKAALNTKNYVLASDFLKQYVILSDSIELSKQKAIVAELEAKYQLKEKNQEIKYVKDLNRSKTKWIYLLIFLIAVSSFFGLVIYYLYRNLQSKYKIIYQKELQKNHTNYAQISNLLDMPSTTTNEIEWKTLWDHINTILLEEELYLDPKLTVEALAKKCNTNKTYIYKCIKSYTSDNFNTFINKYRIEKAKKLILERQDYDVKSIGELSGFNSPRTFFRVFKEITGLSPATFKNLSNNQ